MSLLSAVETAVESWKAEQARIHNCIQLYREILQTLTAEPKTPFIDTELALDANSGMNSPSGETEDMKLLEQALEKALCIRTGRGLSNKDPERSKPPGKELSATAVRSKEVTEASAASKGKHAAVRSTAKSTSLDRKGHREPQTSVSSALASRSSTHRNPGQSKNALIRPLIQKPRVSSAGAVRHKAAKEQSVEAHGTAGVQQLDISSILNKDKSAGSGVLSSEDLGEALPPSNDKCPVSHTDETAAKQNGIPAQAAKWTSLTVKHSRLWDKILAVQRKPVSGRIRFMERMTAMFAEGGPRGSAEQIGALTRRGREPGRQRRTEEPLVPRDPQQCRDPEPGARNRRRPGGGWLSSTGADGETGFGMVAALPLSVTYRRERELRELEELRMRVALLQQEIDLEQVLLDVLFPQLASAVHRGADPCVLRDLCSLLGEGGQRFPAIVLESEPD